VCGSLTQRCFIYHIGSFTYCSDSTHSLLFSSLSPSSLFLDLSLPSRTTTTTNSYALISYNVKRDDLDFAVQITPGLSSPTVQPLAPIKGVKWCSVSAMVARKEVGVAMDKLKALGATGVIVFNLDNCRV
jgi:ATP phosphoribosyltransferase-like protein